MNSKELLKIICKIIQEYMGLEDNQIYIYNQKYIIPNDTGLKICVGLQGEKVYYSGSEIKDYVETIEESSINKQSTISIDIYSYDMSALERKDEIIMALSSNEAENYMNKYNFHIGRIPASFNSINELEGTKILNRYNLLFNVLSKNKKIVNNNFYNKIKVETFINN